MRTFAVGFIIGSFVATTVTHAQQQDDESLLRALWVDPTSVSGVFSDRFLEQVPFAHVRKIVADLNAQCGALQRVEASTQPGGHILKTASCDIRSTIHRDHEGKIVGLWFWPPAQRDLAINDLLETLQSFDGSVSVAIHEDGELIAGHAENEPLAVGSAFKLVVLAALLELIDAGVLPSQGR